MKNDEPNFELLQMAPWDSDEKLALNGNSVCVCVYVCVTGDFSIMLRGCPGYMGLLPKINIFNDN